MQGKDALGHLLQDAQVVPIRGGEAVHPRHDTAEHCRDTHAQPVGTVFIHTHTHTHTHSSPTAQNVNQMYI